MEVNGIADTFLTASNFQRSREFSAAFPGRCAVRRACGVVRC
jgi:hypothetical protein